MRHIMIWALAGFAFVPFLSFAWALRKHFICPGPTPKAMQALSAFSGLTFATFLLGLTGRSAPPAGLLLLGLTVFVFATLLFWWAIRTTSRSDLRVAYQAGTSTGVVSAGPYRFVRHPFYVAYVTFWIGTALAARSWQWIPVLLLIMWYVSIARNEELSLQKSDVGGLYREYRRRTGMFVPRIWR